MQIEKIKAEKLNPAVYNPRKNLQPGDKEYDKLMRSIQTFGTVEPIIVNKRNNVIVGGHQRFTVLKDIGHTEIDCVIVDLNDADEKALNVALNKISGEWQLDKLQELLGEISASDFDVSLTGFDSQELAELFGSEKEKKVKDDGFDVDSALAMPPFSRGGDVWMLGKHRLICGDSTEKSVFDTLMDGQKANLVVTDPPYNVDYSGAAGKIKNDNLSDDEFYKFLLSAFQNTADAIDADASIYVFHADTEGLTFRKAFEAAGLVLTGTCIWKKQSLVLGRSPYQWKHEPILVGHKRGAQRKWYGGKTQSSIWEFDKPKKNKNHPTMKPIPLVAHPIMNSSAENCIVLEPFCGSGSTLIACEQTDRICYAIELDEKFCDVIIRRYIEQVGTDADVFVLRDGAKHSFFEIFEN